MCLVGFQIKNSIMKATSSIDFYSIASCRSKEFIFDEQVNQLFSFGCAEYMRIKMCFIWPIPELELRSSILLCILVYNCV